MDDGVLRIKYLKMLFKYSSESRLVFFLKALIHGVRGTWKTWKYQGKKTTLEKSGKNQGKMESTWKTEIFTLETRKYPKFPLKSKIFACGGHNIINSYS